MLWLVFTLVLVVYWLVGQLPARLAMFVVMSVASYYVAHGLARDPSFIPPLMAIGVVASWFVARIPHRYRRRSNARKAIAEECFWEGQRESLRLADREIRNWR
jgi:hypothetical protein